MQRADLYTGIHKAMRMITCDMLVALGRMDTSDAEEVAATLARLRQVLELSRQHLHKEDQYVHPLMESRRRGSTALMREQHRSHEVAFERLEALALRIEGSRGPGRDEAALELYRCFALYMADDFAHMHEEETENNRVLWAHCEDAELRDIHQAIVAAMDPRLLAEYVRWLAPAMNPLERAGLLAGMRAALSPEAYAGFAALVQSVGPGGEEVVQLVALGPQPLAA